MAHVHVGEADQTYRWVGDWADLPDDDDHDHASGGWAHHDVVVTAAGEVVAFHQDEPTMLVFDRSGSLLRRVPVEVTEAHGMTLVGSTDGSDGEELWVADVGHKGRLDGAGGVAWSLDGPGPRVVRLALDGTLLQALERPDIEAYAKGYYVPTSVVVDEERHGGSGDVWVADGYGASHLHRYDRDGRHLASLRGDESDGGGRFDCPHALFVDRRRPEPELYVADRGNARVQVYGLDGGYRRTVGTGFLNSPSAFATFGDYLVIAELHARLTICDAADEVVCYLGENAEVCTTAGWPNSLDADGHVLRNQLLEPGKFNSPHGLATDADGNIYVSEWLIGGRFTKLERLGRIED